MSIIKRENGIGIKKASVWGTAVVPTTNDGIYVISHTPPKGGIGLVTNKDEFDHDLPTAVYPTEHEEATGSMSMRLYYEGLERILASIFGVYTSSVPEAGVVRHNFAYDPVIGSIFFTIAWDEGDEVKCVPSAKITSGKIYFDDGLKIDIEYAGNKVTLPGWSEPLTITYPSDGKGIFKLVDTTIWINAQSGADFVNGDKVYPSGVSIEPARGYTALPVVVGSDYISEHLETDTPETFIVLNFPKKDTTNESMLTEFQAGTLKKMRIKMEGSTISGKTSKYTLEFDFPMLYLVEAPDFSQDSPLPVTAKFAVLRASAAPTGMTSAVPYAYMINQIAALTGYPAS